MTWRDLAFLVLGAACAWLCAEIKIQLFIRRYTRAAWVSDHPGQTPPPSNPFHSRLSGVFMIALCGIVLLWGKVVQLYDDVMNRP